MVLVGPSILFLPYLYGKKITIYTKKIHYQLAHGMPVSNSKLLDMCTVLVFSSQSICPNLVAYGCMMSCLQVLTNCFSIKHLSLTCYAIQMQALISSWKNSDTMPFIFDTVPPLLILILFTQLNLNSYLLLGELMIKVMVNRMIVVWFSIH